MNIQQQSNLPTFRFRRIIDNLVAEKAEIDTDMNLINSNYNARKNKAASDKLSSYVGKQKQLLDEIEAEKQQVSFAITLFILYVGIYKSHTFFFCIVSLWPFLRSIHFEIDLLDKINVQEANW